MKPKMKSKMKSKMDLNMKPKTKSIITILNEQIAPIFYILFCYGLVQSGCANPNLPWNRSARSNVYWEAQCAQMDEFRRAFTPACAERTTSDPISNSSSDPSVSVDSNADSNNSADSNNPAGSGVNHNEFRYEAGQISENFCQEMESTINSWRQYLNPEFDWSTVRLSKPQVARRVEYLYDLVSQWDQTCQSDVLQSNIPQSNIP